MHKTLSQLHLKNELLGTVLIIGNLRTVVSVIVRLAVSVIARIAVSVIARIAVSVIARIAVSIIVRIAVSIIATGILVIYRISGQTLTRELSILFYPRLQDASEVSCICLNCSQTAFYQLFLI